jgi:predicted lipid-binding transport protein (Tim44 family)
MSTPEKDKQAPAADEEMPAPAPTAESEEHSPEREVLGTGAVGAAIGGFIGGAGGAAIGGMLGLTGGALRDGRKKTRKGWY